MAANDPQTSPSRRVYTVGELNRLIQEALREAFPGSVWVRGEVQRLPSDAARRKHVYFELHDPGAGEAAGYQIPVALMDWDRKAFGLSCYLDGSDPDLQLQERMEVCLECRVDFYPPYGKLSLKCVGLDPSFTLGRLEARRREVLAFLKAAGLLERQAALELPLLPLRVGLITAAGSAAHEDFRSGLAASSYPFEIALASCPMSGADMERRVGAALARLCARGVDVIVICRGGGSRGDLSWFDQEGLAVAVAEAPVPVITAIGHEIDRSIADAVAHRSCKTPTAAAELLVCRVDESAARLRDAAAGTVRAARRGIDLAGARLARAAAVRQPSLLALQLASGRLGSAGGRLERRVAGRLAGDRRLLEARRTRLQLALERRLAAARAGWEARRDRIGRAVPVRLQTEAVRLDSLAQKARLLDPEHLLARGYTLTLDRQGRLLRSASEVAPGMVLATRFHDGSVTSVAGPAGRDGGPAAPRRRRGAARGGKSEPAQEEPAGEAGQGDLFR